MSARFWWMLFVIFGIAAFAGIQVSGYWIFAGVPAIVALEMMRRKCLVEETKEVTE
jgi:hypothetical protein